MNLNRVEWSRAQDLLLKLVQILTPLTDQEASAPSLFLTKRFFVPPLPLESESFHFRHPVCLLSTLHSVQKQVTQWIDEEFSFPEERTSSAPEKRETPIPPFREKSTAAPLSIQAKRLIDQVHDAIGKLCTSVNIKDPKEEPLKQALRRLKPSLDQIVEAVSKDEMPETKEGKFKHPLPVSYRERLIQKFTFAQQREPLGLKSRAEAQIESLVRKKEAAESKEKTIDKPTEKEKSVELSIPNHPSEKAKAADLSSVVVPFVKQEKKEIVKSSEKTSIPVIPFISPTRPLPSSRKQIKKKRKGFWFREDNEDPISEK